MANPTNKIPVSDVMDLRAQGLADSFISEELKKRGYSAQQIAMALSQADGGENMGLNDFNSNYPGQQMPAAPASYPAGPSYPTQPAAPAGADDGVFERIEETVENLIDEKWDELLGEVRKIIEWKEKFEEMHIKMQSDIDKLKEDFKLLHQGVLGKLDDYDHRMIDVDTELKAVGKVFKDVVPEFVENVKELSSITKIIKKK